MNWSAAASLSYREIVELSTEDPLLTTGIGLASAPQTSTAIPTEKIFIIADSVRDPRIAGEVVWKGIRVSYGVVI
jgi:hypothetical protein